MLDATLLCIVFTVSSINCIFKGFLMILSGHASPTTQLPLKTSLLSYKHVILASKLGLLAKNMTQVACRKGHFAIPLFVLFYNRRVPAGMIESGLLVPAGLGRTSAADVLTNNLSAQKDK